MRLSERLLILVRSFALCHYLAGFLLFLTGWVFKISDPLLFSIPLLSYGIAFFLSRKAFRGFDIPSLKRDLARFPKLPFFIILLFLTLNFLFCLLPPAENLEGDALNYHLAIPWQYYLRGKAVPLDWSVADKYPLYLQMAELPFMVLAFPWIIKIWNMATLPALMIVLFSLLGLFRLSLPQKGFIPALAVSCLLFATQYGSALFDLTNTLYIIIAFYSLLRAYQNRTTKDLIYGSLFMGMSCALKTFYVYFVFAWIFPFLIWRLCQTPKNLKKMDFAYVVTPLLAALVFLLPFWTRNFLNTGNPIFPLFSHFFNSPFDNAGVLERVRHQFGYGFSLFDFFLLPIRLVLPIRKFDYWTDPLLLVFLAGSLVNFRKKWKAIDGLLFLICFFIYTAVFITSQQARFFYPFWFLIIPLGSCWVLKWFKEKPLFLLMVGQTLLGLVFFFYLHRQAIRWILQKGPYLEKASYSYNWNKEIQGMKIKQLCLRHIKDNFAPDILYFEVPVKLIQHFNTTLRLASPGATEGCDFFMTGNQDYQEKRDDPKTKGTLVSREEFLALPKEIHSEGLIP